MMNSMINGTIVEKSQTADSLELPVFLPPPVNAYLPLSIISSIIMAHDTSESWLYNNFIQLYQKPLSTRIEFYPNQDFDYADQSLLSVTELSSQNYRLAKEDFLDNIIYWLNNANYVIIYASESEVPGTRYFGKTPILQSQLIVGYDLSKKVFKLLNYSDKTDQMAILDIKFDDLFKAFFSNATKELYEIPKLNWTKKNKKFKIVLLRYKDNGDPSYTNRIDPDIINYQLNNYVNSINSSLSNNYFTSIQEGTWGISIYNNFKNYINKNIGLSLDFRQFQLLYEHKTLMLLRFKMLGTRFDINYDNEGLEHLCIIAKKMKTLCIDYNKSLDSTLAIEIQNLTDKLYEKETKILTSYLTKYR